MILYGFYPVALRASPATVPGVGYLCIYLCIHPSIHPSIHPCIHRSIEQPIDECCAVKRYPMPEAEKRFIAAQSKTRELLQKAENISLIPKTEESPKLVQITHKINGAVE